LPVLGDLAQAPRGVFSQPGQRFGAGKVDVEHLRLGYGLETGTQAGGRKQTPRLFTRLGAEQAGK
jgi:hypothetical protein